MTDLNALLYPELQGFAPASRGAALRRARRAPLDWIELAGLGLAVVAVAGLTRYAAAELDALARLSAAAANLVLAVPLLALAAGPFLLRRTRRALREALDGREARPAA